MTFQELGYYNTLDAYRKEETMASFGIGRVTLEHKDRYVVKTDVDEFDAELVGSLRFSAVSRYDLPAVGDWVAISEYDEKKALIHAVYPRQSVIERQAVGKSGQIQIIATNIDYALILQSVNRDFNINRIERYLSICNTSNVKPILVLSKIDLVDESVLNSLLNELKERIAGVSIIAISNQSKEGLDNIKAILKKGKTYCLLGSSGVGKSTLLNLLNGEDLMHTGAISERIDRGKHITTHRELVVLENGGILIDNPGMREVGVTDSSTGIAVTFEEIIGLSDNCKFKNCTHTTEEGCAILEAVENGTIDLDSFTNFQKMEKERVFFELSVVEKKKKDKNFGKMIKNVKKHRKNNKF